MFSCLVPGLPHRHQALATASARPPSRRPFRPRLFPSQAPCLGCSHSTPQACNSPCPKHNQQLPPLGPGPEQTAEHPSLVPAMGTACFQRGTDGLHWPIGTARVGVRRGKLQLSTRGRHQLLVTSPPGAFLNVGPTVWARVSKGWTSRRWLPTSVASRELLWGPGRQGHSSTLLPHPCSILALAFCLLKRWQMPRNISTSRLLPHSQGRLHGLIFSSSISAHSFPYGHVSAATRFHESFG